MEESVSWQSAGTGCLSNTITEFLRDSQDCPHNIYLNLAINYKLQLNVFTFTHLVLSLSIFAFHYPILYYTNMLNKIHCTNLTWQRFCQQIGCYRFSPPTTSHRKDLYNSEYHQATEAIMYRDDTKKTNKYAREQTRGNKPDCSEHGKSTVLIYTQVNKRCHWNR